MSEILRRFTMSFRRVRATFIAIALSVGTAAVAPAAQIEGVRFEPSVTIGSRTLGLNGYGLLRYKVLLKAYVAALYLERDTDPAEVLGDVPKRLEIEYFWGISAADFVSATNDRIAANVSQAELAAIRPAIDRLNTLYRDVKPGDRYALTYLPEVGTELSLNGVPLGTVAERDLGRAVFSIWLGNAPLDTDLKTALLGR